MCMLTNAPAEFSALVVSDCFSSMPSDDAVREGREKGIFSLRNKSTDDHIFLVSKFSLDFRALPFAADDADENLST